MDTAIGIGQTSRAGTSLAQVDFQLGLLGMFISLPLLGAQTVGGGTMVLNTAEAEGDLAANFFANVLTVYVWRPSTGSKVGNLFSGIMPSGSEPTAANSEQVTHNAAITSSGVAAADGDVIVCEVWGRHGQADAVARTCTFYYDGTTENVTENAVVSNHASYLELAETLSFQPTSVAAADTLTPNLTEASASLGLLARVDTITPSLADSVSLSSLLARADTLTPSLTDVVQAVVSLLTADAITPSVTDASALLALLARTDTMTPALVEAAQIIGALTGTDTLTPSVADAVSLLASLSLADTLTPSLADTGTVQIPIVGADTLTPSLLDVQSLLKLLLDPRATVLLRSRFVNDVHIGISDASVHIGNAPITVTKRD